MASKKKEIPQKVIVSFVAQVEVTMINSHGSDPEDIARQQLQKCPELWKLESMIYGRRSR